MEAAGLQIKELRGNDYAFLSGQARRASARYGVRSIDSPQITVKRSSPLTTLRCYLSGSDLSASRMTWLVTCGP